MVETARARSTPTRTDREPTAPPGESNDALPATIAEVYAEGFKKVSPKQTPRGRVTKVQVLKRRQIVSAMIAAGVEDHVIKAELAAKFGTSKAVVAKLMSWVIRSWADTDVERRPHARLMAVVRLQGHIVSAKSGKAWGAVASLERLLAEIQGTRQPEEVHVKIDAELRESVAVVVAGMTPERLVELADRALRLREVQSSRAVLPPPPLVVEAEAEPPSE